MTVSPYSDAAAILDAAASGERALGFEAVGDLLVDLGRTTSISNGEAMRSSAVAAASAASAPGAMAGVIGFLKPAVVIVGMSIAAFAVGMSLRSPAGPGTVTIRPATAEPVGAERIVESVPGTEPSDDMITDTAGSVPDNSTGTDGDASSGAAAASNVPTSDGSSDTTGTSAAPPTSGPTTSVPPSTTTADPVDSTTSSTSTTTTTTTTVVPTTTEALGNNGNGNGNGVGNGKGNQGNGNGNGGNGNGGNGNGENGGTPGD